MGRVNEKVVIVTGGASNPGLGYSTALALGREKANVVVTDIHLGGAQDCADEITARGGTAIALRHDVTSEQEWRDVVAATIQHFGRIDVLVNNAGIAILKRFTDLTLDDWNRQLVTNLTSVFLGCRTAMEVMRHNGGGSIINLSSVAALVGMPRCGAYGASKGGIRSLSRTVAIDGAADNIRCNSVFPGVIWTNMQSEAVDSRDNSNPAISSDRIPLGRAGTPDDIANCILYLASDEADYVTGAEFTIDAGMTAK